MSKVEEIARLLAWQQERQNPHSTCAGPHEMNIAWPQYVANARELIEAMREPTKAMTEDDSIGIFYWNRMIDAALSEKP